MRRKKKQQQEQENNTTEQKHNTNIKRERYRYLDYLIYGIHSQFECGKKK